MSYVIKSTSVEMDTLITVVEYTFTDGSKQEVLIPHFMPESKAVVITGIENREVSEQRKLDAAVANTALKALIDADIV